MWLSKLITTNTIATGTKSDFLFCVLGEVNSPKVPDNMMPRLGGVTSLLPDIAVDNPVMSVISLNDIWSHHAD